ncbi:MAG: acyl-CoA dehydrogenase family protein [Actinomycetota bacterium]
MRFAFTDEQLAMRDAARDFLEQECPPKVVRDAWTNETGRSGLWRKLGEIGVLGVLAPEAQGGLGGDFLDLILLLEESGRAALPEPVVEHAAVAVPELDDATDAVTGAVTVTTVAYSPQILYADSADLVLHDRRFAEPEALELERVDTVDRSRHVFALSDLKTSIADDVAERGVLGTAAQLLGLAQHLLDLAVEYAQQRRQFGVPIGSFQAIKHKLADVRLALEFARPVVYRAAYSVARDDPERSVHVSMAKAYASDAALLSARHALQVHGAIGYSFEHDIHLWMKRAWALAAAWGDTAWHRERVGRAILGPERKEP